MEGNISELIITEEYGKGVLIDLNGNLIDIPHDWEFLPAGDAGLTRKVTAMGKCYRVQFKKGRRIISKGIWTSACNIKKAESEISAVRETEQYKSRLEYSRKKRDEKQSEYEVEFFNAVCEYLNFSSQYKALERCLAEAVTNHAVPVGSKTVARTKMISLEERAAFAVTAWMRHNTTEYDSMKIPNIKGKRREVRRGLVKESFKLLDRYRRGESFSGCCPLSDALDFKG